MKTIVKITTAQAVAMFLDYNKELATSGVAFSNITYFVDEAKSKTVDKKKVVQKKVSANATIGSDYEKKVGRILDKEGKNIDFKAQPQFGKEYITDGMPVLKDTKTGQKRYLVFIVENHTTPQTLYYVNGEHKTREEVFTPEYMTPAGLRPSTSTAGRNTIEEENMFYFRTLNFDNLRGFNMNGNQYLIEN